jgi:hypothetical protein
MSSIMKLKTIAYLRLLKLEVTLLVRADHYP